MAPETGNGTKSLEYIPKTMVRLDDYCMQQNPASSSELNGYESPGGNAVNAYDHFPCEARGSVDTYLV